MKKMDSAAYRTGPLEFAYGNNEPCLSLPDLKISKGAVTVITGENGSGKTTLLKILGGLLQVSGKSEDSGLAQILEESVYLHQNPYLFRGTVARNMKLISSNTEDINQALTAVGLEGFSDRKVHTLSGGEKRRAALARIFLSGKKLLLLDEPAAHVDAASMRKIESACRDYAEKGRTVVISSHRGSFGYRTADEIIELNEGRRIYSSINILKGTTVERKDGYLFFQSGDTTIKAPMMDGSFQAAVIRGEDILLSKNPLDSSARNCLKGKVSRLTKQEKGLFSVELDCGVVLKSVITGSAAAEMNIVPGAEIYAVFKASSVALY